jgi:hypothetical protein
MTKVIRAFLDIQCLIVGAEPQLLIADGPSQELPLVAPPSPRDASSMAAATS